MHRAKGVCCILGTSVLRCSIAADDIGAAGAHYSSGDFNQGQGTAADWRPVYRGWGNEAMLFQQVR